MGTIYKVWKFQFLKLSQLCSHFLSSFVNRNDFFYIPSNPLPIAVRNSLTNQFFQQNWRFCIFSTTKKCKTEEKRRVISAFEIVQTLLPFFVKFWKWKLFFLIFLAIPRPSRSGIYWPINFSKKNWRFCILKKKINKCDKFI